MQNCFDKEKYVLHCASCGTYLTLRIKTKKIHVWEFNQLQCFKPFVELNLMLKKWLQRLKNNVQFNEQCCIL